MKTFPATYRTAMLAVPLALASLVSAAGESDIVRVQFRELDTLLANRTGSTMLGCIASLSCSSGIAKSLATFRKNIANTLR
jgi:hypothetical protein